MSGVLTGKAAVMVDSDEVLYARAKGGDMRAFDGLYARYEGCLFGFVLSQVRNPADAEDVFHEAFVSALKAPTVKFDAGGGFRAWIYRIARNLVINRARSQHRGARALTGLAENMPEHALRSDDAIADREMREALENAVAKLPPALSEVFHLRASGLRYEEIADVLEIPLGTLKSRMNQMVNQLREELRPWTVG